ncbi:hypothetical protein TMatcc_001233 [Talaromyces marneffei ATCC 18224]|uniref:Uncharacterized protein n=1 Tax=Talaromyces marneffei (strain ATCC 18224 / CBS 334.59 / QM 7333) TaxID=441960 RepID=B6QWM8_TALMQ|nr:conserved hypothetical protein [Talaromyces marneffei ATCC 18224]
MATELRTENVTDVEHSDEKLKERYKQVTGREGTIEEVKPNPVSVRGPYSYTTAIVVWLNSDTGTVKLFFGNENIKTWQTSPTFQHEVVMAFLEPGYYSWWINGAKVKYIT